MLGPAKPRRLDQPIAVSLDALVPQDNVSRQLEATLDLGFVRDWAQDLYAERGRPSSDPIVFFKLQLIMFFEGIRSERQLIAIAALNLAHRWYLGYALDETLPDHSSLTRIRQRLGVDVFQRFFERVVALCQETGLVWGKELYFDGTKVEANADFDSLVPRFSDEAKRHVGDLFADEQAPNDGGSSTWPDLAAGVVRLLADSDANAPAPRDERPWRLLEERRLDPRRPSDGAYDRMSLWQVSPTDPDATPMRTGARTTLGYHDHSVVDGGKRRIILAAFVTPADVTDNMPLRDLLWRVCFRRKIWPQHVTGDAKYGTIENIVAIERQHIRAYVPLSAAGHRAGMFGEADFAYDPATDGYRCPGGQALRFLSQSEATQRRIYQAPTTACARCTLRAQCTTSPRGRRVSRSLDETFLDRVRAYHATEAYQKAIRKNGKCGGELAIGVPARTAARRRPRVRDGGAPECPPPRPDRLAPWLPPDVADGPGSARCRPPRFWLGATPSWEWS